MQTLEQPIETPTEVVAESHVVERPKNHLNEEENKLLKALLTPGASVEAQIPEDADPTQLWKTLDACVRGHDLLNTRICRLKPIIGRILLIFEKKPSLYKALGYETYTDFMKRGVYEKIGMHASWGYEGKFAARDWPQLTPDRYAEIGPKKLEILKHVTTGRNSNAETWLDTAKRMKVAELRQYVEDRNLTARGETQGASFIIHTNQDKFKLFKSFFGDGRIHSKCDSKEWDVILQCAIQEVYDQWIDQYEQDRLAKIAQREGQGELNA